MRCRPREAGRHQTALRGRARCPIRAADCRSQEATPQKPLRADEPVNQNGELNTLGVDGVLAGELRRNRDLRESGTTAGKPRRLSSLSLGRRAASVGRWSGISRALTVRSPVRGPIPNHTGSGVCRSATSEVEPQKSVAISGGRRCCPSSACSSPGRAGVSRVEIRRRSSLLLRSGFGFVPVTPLCLTG